MSVKELIQTGQLVQARKQLVDLLKKNPADIGSRTALFQVLCFVGDLDKAEKHLDILLAQDQSVQGGVQQYKTLLAAEKLRQATRDGREEVRFLPKESKSAELLKEANRALRNGDKTKAVAAIEGIQAICGRLGGTMNGEPFTGASDVDSFFNGFLEAVVYDQYVLIPFSSIRELLIEPPLRLSDLFWCTAIITTRDDLTLNAFLPVLYPGSHEQDDGLVNIGQKTLWTLDEDEFLRGSGQHLLTLGDNDYGLLDIRELVFSHQES